MSPAAAPGCRASAARVPLKHHYKKHRTFWPTALGSVEWSFCGLLMRAGLSGNELVDLREEPVGQVRWVLSSADGVTPHVD